MCRAAFAMIPKGFNLLSFVLVIHFLTVIWRGVLRQLPSQTHGRAGIGLFFVVIRLVSHCDALFSELLHPLSIDLDTTGSRLRQGVIGTIEKSLS